MDSTNMFIISHKGDVLLDKFDRTLKFEKPNEFSHCIEDVNIPSTHLMVSYQIIKSFKTLFSLVGRSFVVMRTKHMELVGQLYILRTIYI